MAFLNHAIIIGIFYKWNGEQKNELDRNVLAHCWLLFIVCFIYCSDSQFKRTACYYHNYYDAKSSSLNGKWQLEAFFKAFKTIAIHFPHLPSSILYFQKVNPMRIFHKSHSCLHFLFTTNYLWIQMQTKSNTMNIWTSWICISSTRFALLHTFQYTEHARMRIYKCLNWRWNTNRTGVQCSRPLFVNKSDIRNYKAPSSHPASQPTRVLCKNLCYFVQLNVKCVLIRFSRYGSWTKRPISKIGNEYDFNPTQQKHIEGKIQQSRLSIQIYSRTNFQ